MPMYFLKLYCPFTAFNDMDENHDGKISQAEFVEVLIGHYPGPNLICSFLISGLSCPEEVFYNVDTENHRRFHNRRSAFDYSYRKNQIEN